MIAHMYVYAIGLTRFGQSGPETVRSVFLLPVLSDLHVLSQARVTRLPGQSTLEQKGN